MGYLLTLSTAEKFLERHGNKILQALQNKGLYGTLQLHNEILVYQVDEPIWVAVPIGYANEEHFEVFKTNIGPDLAKELTGEIEDDE